MLANRRKRNCVWPCFSFFFLPPPLFPASGSLDRIALNPGQATRGNCVQTWQWLAWMAPSRLLPSQRRTTANRERRDPRLQLNICRRLIESRCAFISQFLSHRARNETGDARLLVYTVYRKSQLLTTSPLATLRTKVFPPGLSTGFDIKRSPANWIVCPLESLIFASCCRPFNPQLRTITEPPGRTESELSFRCQDPPPTVDSSRERRWRLRAKFQRCFFIFERWKEIWTHVVHNEQL